uniref:CUE domain containing 2 n=1 Tax=Chelydra serpentina TaxID=8475 RepID=A0A8C3SIL7_CHESE
MDLERIIRDSLTCFIQSHIPDADLSGMDEVVFSYITRVLEELGSPESSEENFDTDTLVEMMEAYIPGFAEINSGNICEMMFALSERLSEARNRGKLHGGVPSPLLPSRVSPGLSYPDQGADGDLKDGVELLLEMFPACTLSQAQKALAMALGNLEEAVQLLVEEKVEPGPGGANVKVLWHWQQHRGALEETVSTNTAGYMMVDSEEDQKTHRPLPPKEAPKKLIRYIDNQVVSTKGERYKDIKKPESEEMKRTYISLKPAKKYKFY